VVQSTRKIPGDAAAGFAAYLTTTSSRGDYYLDGDGEAPQGRWHGPSGVLADLGIDGECVVERGALLSVMRGVSPVSGLPFRRAGGDGSRVAGIDLTFSAPKSVSALWAVSSPYRRAQIEVAHQRAVASTLARIESEVELVRRRVGGRGGRLVWERARGLVAAEFVHTASRLTRGQEQGNGVADPQLHSHLLVLAAERVDGRLAAVDSRELFRAARANGAWYRAELAANLVDLGLGVQGRTGRDGRYFEVKGVPQGLSERWSARSEDIARAARVFRKRYGRDPRAGELGALTVRTRGAKSTVARVDVDAAWRAVGEEYGLDRSAAEALFGGHARSESRDLHDELIEDVCRERATLTGRELQARAYELAAGVCCPAQGRATLDALVARGELIELEGDLWTTRAQRDLERHTLDTIAGRRQDDPAPVTGAARRAARVGAEQRLDARLSREQEDALDVVTGCGGVSVLVGEAGTGKGVVIGAANDAWTRSGHRVIGTAVAGVTAKRLGADTGIAETMTTDALLRRHGEGRLGLDGHSVVVMDEAAMADTPRLGALAEATARTGSRLVLAGDDAQLSSIGAGGLFKAIQQRAPSAQLTEVQRAREDWERKAWTQLRAGESSRALAAYEQRGRLHISDTRTQAGEQMVDDWDHARRQPDAGRVVMITDASNTELDRLNALAQDRRAQAGKLGSSRAALPGRPYDLAVGDDVIFTASHHRRGAERVENGTLARVTHARGHAVRLTTEEAEPREISVDTLRFSDLRLGYAQHVYKAQGATVDRALVLCGGWQTDREHGYVALTRGRTRTDVYVSREDLGEDGLDAGAITRLADRLAHSRRQHASIEHRQAPVRAERQPRVPGLEGERRESEVGRVLREQRERERARGRGRGHGRD